MTKGISYNESQGQTLEMQGWLSRERVFVIQV